MRTDQPGQLGNLAKHIPGRDDVLDRLDRLERRTYGLSSSPQTTFIEGGQTVPYILKLSPTDAAHNDAEIEKAIASFNGATGTIYAPACPPNAPADVFHDNFGTWPISRRHDFKNCDLLGSGAFGNSGATIDESYPGTVFFCTAPDAGFVFSGVGYLTGGFQINGGRVASNLFSRPPSSFGTGFDTGRLFVNIYLSDSGPSQDIGKGSGFLVANYFSPATTMTLTVTNDGGVASTSPLTVATTSAADVKAALEGLSNVGSGNVLVDSTDLGLTPQLGGPWHFNFLAGASPESVLTTDVADRYSVPYVISEITQASSMAYMQGFLDTYINFATSAAWEHNLFIDVSDVITFVNMTIDNCGGYGIYLREGTDLVFTGGEWDGAGLSLVYSDGDMTNCQFNGQSTYYQGASPQFDFGRTSSPVSISNLNAGGNHAPVIRAGSAVTLSGGILWRGSSVFAIFYDEFEFIDNKAQIYPPLDLVANVVYQGAATGAQMATQTPTGLAHAGFAGFFAAPPIAQPTAGGVSTGYTTGVGLPVLADGTFTGGVGTTAYTLDDVVAALKNLGLLTS